MTHLTWDRGGEATFIEADDDRVRVRSTSSAAPGSRIEGALTTGERVRIKVHGCKRLAPEDDAFEIHGRLIDAPRALRESLRALVSPREA